MYNKIIIMGRIASDLELKTTPNGVSVCSFRVAVDRHFQIKGEDKKTDFFNVVAWRNCAEFVTKYFSKGQMIHFDGEMQTRQYTDKNGNPATWYEIVAESVSFTGNSTKSDKPDKSAAPVQSEPELPEAPAEKVFGVGEDIPEDDYPF